MEKFAEFPNADKEVVFIAYSSATEEMLQVAKNCCSNAGFKQIIPAQAGGTICAHCGPNTVGVMFFGKSE